MQIVVIPAFTAFKQAIFSGNSVRLYGLNPAPTGCAACGST
jgi:hypothetical protein